MEAQKLTFRQYLEGLEKISKRDADFLRSEVPKSLGKAFEELENVPVGFIQGSLELVLAREMRRAVEPVSVEAGELYVAEGQEERAMRIIKQVEPGWKLFMLKTASR